MTAVEMIDVRGRIAEATAGLFAHADYPLEHSLDHTGDPGLFGPGSATWQVVGDVSTFVGGIRALLIQSAHPEVVAGVADHSAYEDDPLGRLSRTSAYVTATAFGSLPEVEEAIRVVRRAHGPVKGTSHRGERYAASGPPLAAWVHNALVDSFLTTYQVFGPAPLSETRADAFVAEQAELGMMLHAGELPRTAADLSTWIATNPSVGASPAMRDAMRFLADPPLPAGPRLGYHVLFRAAAATVPDRIRDVLGLRTVPGALMAGKALVAMLRWSMGSSPSWWLALERANAPAPPGVSFRRCPPAIGAEERWRIRYDT